MPWTASDVASVITTATTALSALTGLVLPLADRYWNAEARRKDAFENSFLEPLTYCLDHFEDVDKLHRDQAMNLAFLNAGKFVTASAVSKELEDILNLYNVNRRRLELQALRCGIDIK